MAHSNSFLVRGNIIYQTLENETLIINLENGRYYSLNAPASVIWEALAKHHTIQETAALFAPQDVSESERIKCAIADFAAELVSEELLSAATVPPRALPPLQVQNVVFETPHLEKFTDMERLLPLDPIHQVGELGWPFQSQENLS